MRTDITIIQIVTKEKSHTYNIEKLSRLAPFW